MGIDDFKARLDQLFAEAGPSGTARAESKGLHEALVALKAGLNDLRQALDRTERELAQEREQLATAVRRGELAAGIQDTETVAIAKEFAERHGRRVELLERKVAVQRDELALAEQEYQALAEQYRSSRPGAGAGAAPPPPSDDADLLKTRLDRKAFETAAEAQLELLKKKMGKS